MRGLTAAVVMASLASCAPYAPACPVPAPGDACPAFPDPADARAFVAARVWCPDGAEPVVSERSRGDVEFACVSPAGWRMVAGVVGRAWGLVYLAANGSLVVCDNAGRVEDVMPLLHDDTGRYWHVISPSDAACLETGACSVAPDPCAPVPGVEA